MTTVARRAPNAPVAVLDRLPVTGRKKSRSDCHALFGDRSCDRSRIVVRIAQFGAAVIGPSAAMDMWPTSEHGGLVALLAP
jgi:hypothetical protein